MNIQSEIFNFQLFMADKTPAFERLNTILVDLFSLVNSWDRMKMDDCSECHQKEKVSQNSVQTLKGGCFVCHK